MLENIDPAAALKAALLFIAFLAAIYFAEMKRENPNE